MGSSFPIIAIDGASGTGKSSTALLLSQKLKFLHVDTGAHYRALTWLLEAAKVLYTEPKTIEELLGAWRIEAQVIGGAAQILINGQSFSEAQLRCELVNNAVFRYSPLPAVRKSLLGFQRSMTQVAVANAFTGLVMEGRDIGTNIFPQTPYKYFFLTDPNIKAARRAQEGITDVTQARDLIDSTQGQLRRPADAVAVDTTSRSLEEVVNWLYADITNKLKIS